MAIEKYCTIDTTRYDPVDTTGVVSPAGCVSLVWPAEKRQLFIIFFLSYSLLYLFIFFLARDRREKETLVQSTRHFLPRKKKNKAKKKRKNASYVYSRPRRRQSSPSSISLEPTREASDRNCMRNKEGERERGGK